MLELLALLPQCAPTVAPRTMAAIVKVESTQNPYAIGVVGGRLVRQPRTLDEAIATARHLEATGWNFSLGVAQVNRYNLSKHGLTYATAFDPCANLSAGGKILEDCYVRAKRHISHPDNALQAALSCYYSGNFTRGFFFDAPGKPSYVQKVWLAAAGQTTAIPVVPSIRNTTNIRPPRTPVARPKVTSPRQGGSTPLQIKAEQKAEGSGEYSNRQESLTASPPETGAPADESNDRQPSSVIVF